jgi:hypothetical protein
MPRKCLSLFPFCPQPSFLDFSMPRPCRAHPPIEVTFSLVTSQPSSHIYCNGCRVYREPAKFCFNRVGAPYQPCIDCSAVRITFFRIILCLQCYILLGLAVYVLLPLPISRVPIRVSPEPSLCRMNASFPLDLFRLSLLRGLFCLYGYLILRNTGRAFLTTSPKRSLMPLLTHSLFQVTPNILILGLCRQCAFIVGPCTGSGSAKRALYVSLSSRFAAITAR